MSSNASDPEPFDEDTVRIPRAGAEDAAAAASPSTDAADADATGAADADDAGAADAATTPDDVIDDRTVVSVRRADAAPSSDTDDLEATVLSRSGEPPAPAPEATAAPGPRRARVEGDESEPDEGSTMVARRETRRRAARDLEAQTADSAGHDQVLASTRAADVPAPVRRIARTPEPPAATYTPREPHVARVERTAPEPHAPQAYVDTAALESSARARRRSGVVIGVVLGLCLLAAAVAGLIALATAG